MVNKSKILDVYFLVLTRKQIVHFLCGVLAHVTETVYVTGCYFGLCSDCQTVLVELLVTMVSQQITAEELALLIRLFLEKTPPTVNGKPYHSINKRSVGSLSGCKL